jgi:transcriptional regulator with XRE-family HTH domain
MPSLNSIAAKQVGTWLRALRLSTRPEDVGISSSPRGRGACLTQVELARLADVTPRAYQAVEQGHRLPGGRLLEGVADALRLDNLHRDYLHRLARPMVAPLEPAPDAVALAALVSEFRSPAVVFDRAWNVLAYNRPLANSWPVGECAPSLNLLVWFFTSRTARRMIGDWEAEAAELIGRLRNVHAYYPGDPVLRAVVDELRQRSAHARQLWDHDVRVAADPSTKVREVRRDSGRVERMTTVLLQIAGRADPLVRLAFCLPDRSGMQPG